MIPGEQRGRTVLALILAVLVPAMVSAVVPGQEGAGQQEPGQDDSGQEDAGQEDAEMWRGTIEVPGQQLEFFVTFTPAEAGGFTGTIDIPAQGAEDVPLQGVVYEEGEEGRVEFQLTSAGASWAGAREAEDPSRASGEFTQGGMTFPFSMERTEEGPAAPPRPQHPEPPYPYDVHEVTYPSAGGDVTLAATLTVPSGSGPHPGALLITGSGAQDRDETIFHHRPFLVLADHLTRNGIAVLRADDRGVGGSTGSVGTSTADDFVADALGGVAFLRSRPEVDGARLGLVGHSEGGVIAPMAAARPDDVAFIVLLAGTAVPGREILPEQLEAIQLGLGVPRENVDRQVEAQARLLDLVAADAEREAIEAAVGDLIDVQFENNPAAGPEAREATLQGQLQAVTSPWFRHFLTNDPARYLEEVDCPVLALNGSLDLQVVAETNLPAIEEALRAGGNDDVTVEELTGLNHLFQPAATGLPRVTNFPGPPLPSPRSGRWAGL